MAFATIVDGVVVGATGLRAVDFPTLRTFATGSWLGREIQGTDKEMRLATITVGSTASEPRRRRPRRSRTTLHHAG